MIPSVFICFTQHPDFFKNWVCTIVTLTIQIINYSQLSLIPHLIHVPCVAVFLCFYHYIFS